jgi:hypothetical protein
MKNRKLLSVAFFTPGFWFEINLNHFEVERLDFMATDATRSTAPTFTKRLKSQ